MDSITPIDLESASFPLVRKGYDTKAVSAMLKVAAAKLESVNRELQELHQSSESDQKELTLFRQKQTTLADALVLAQKTADETRFNAHKEAELIVEKAKLEAAGLKSEAKNELADVERKIEQRTQDKKNFEARFRSLLRDYESSLRDAPTLHLEEDEAA